MATSVLVDANERIDSDPISVLTWEGTLEAGDIGLTLFAAESGFPDFTRVLDVTLDVITAGLAVSITSLNYNLPVKGNTVIWTTASTIDTVGRKSGTFTPEVAIDFSATEAIPYPKGASILVIHSGAPTGARVRWQITCERLVY